MKNRRKLITVFEHQTIKLNEIIDSEKFDESMLSAMQNYFGEKGVPYFSLIHKGIRFNEYVGIIQIGNTVIEVLPKADYITDNNNTKKQWRDILINMLRAIGIFDIHAPSSSSLKLKPSSILDLYFELFITEIEYLLHNGLVKQYRKREGNVFALKGSLQFNKHIQKNITHQERFYVRYTTYDTEHKLHLILYKTILLLKQLNSNISLHSRICSLLLYFPEMPDIAINESVFDTIVFNRKTQSYKKAIEIAKLLLLQYHPDVITGRNNVLALMFDMNKLWEQFVYASICKYKNNSTVITKQCSKNFWKSEKSYGSKIRPDIVITKDNHETIVLDTKWKNLYDNNPSPDDLRQMYVYHEYYHANKVALIYPGKSETLVKGVYLSPDTSDNTTKVCSVISIPVADEIIEWQKKINNMINTL